jgi:nanoRNase/pAp phosphatase (c-di-AMP/oligoRNAs hydrolase)
MPKGPADDARAASLAFAPGVPLPLQAKGGNDSGAGGGSGGSWNPGVVGRDKKDEQQGMTAFVESCLHTAAGSAVAVERRSRRHPRARRLIKLLHDKKHILITTHQFPDPDALASSIALALLIRTKLKGARVDVSIKGKIGGGYNAAFAQQSELQAVPWDDEKLSKYDAIILCDTQPLFKFSPLPPGTEPFAIIDHHRSRGGDLPGCDFCDVRTEVGATASIVFSYFMELEVDIPPDLAATMLFAIETDLAGAAGQPGDLDNVALSNLTLIADTRKLYAMRYADLPQSVYIAHASGLNNAVYYDSVLVTHIEAIETPETPAIIADFLLRFDPTQWVLVTAVRGNSLVLSLRTSTEGSAADVARRMLRNLGEGGGHRTKAGGSINLETNTPAEVERLRTLLRRRLLRALRIPSSRGQRLVPRPEDTAKPSPTPLKPRSRKSRSSTSAAAPARS